MPKDDRARARKRYTRKFQEQAADKLAQQTVSYLFTPSSIAAGENAPTSGKPPYKTETKDDKEVDVIIDGQKVIDVDLDGKRVHIYVDPESSKITNLRNETGEINVDVVRACLVKLGQTPVVEPKAGAPADGPYYDRMKPGVAIDRLFRAMAQDDRKDPPYVPPSQVVRDCHQYVNERDRQEIAQRKAAIKAQIEASQPTGGGFKLFGRRNAEDAPEVQKPADSATGPK